MEEINDMNKNGNKNNNHFNNKNGHNNSQQHNSKGGRGFSKPGPFGFKPRPQSNKEQAAANPFGFASHNDDEVKKIIHLLNQIIIMKREDLILQN